MEDGDEDEGEELLQKMGSTVETTAYGLHWE